MALVNALLVRWPGGYHEVVDADSVAAHDRHEGYLSLNAASVEDVERVARAFFAQWAEPSVALSAGIEPAGDGDVPLADFRVADYLTVDGDAVRARALTVTEDEDGNPTYALELGTLRQETEIRVARWLQRMADGSVGGTSLAASPVPTPSSVRLGTAARPGVPPFSLPGVVTLDDSGTWVSEVNYRLVRVIGTLRVAGSTATVVIAKKNGATVGTLTIPAGSTGPVSATLGTDFLADVDKLAFETTSAGAGAYDLVVIPRAA